MKQAEPKKRYVLITGVLLVWMIVGTIIQQFFDSDTLSFDLDSGTVIASTRDQYTFGSPLMAHVFSSTIIQKGKLIHILPADQDTTGSKAQTILKTGRAHLELKNAAINVGNFNSPQIRALNTLSPINDAPAPPPNAIVDALTKLHFIKLSIQDSAIDIVLPGGFSERLSQSRLIVKKRDESAVRVTGTAIWRGQEVTIDLQTGPLSGDQSHMPLSFSLKGDYISVRFTGALSKRNQHSLEGDLKFEIKQSQKLVQSLNLIWPSLATAKTFRLSGPIKWSQNSISFDKANVKLDKNEASGALTIKTDAARPLLSGTLAFDELDLTPNTPPGYGDISLVNRWQLIISHFWSTPITKLFDSDLRLSAKKVVVGSTELKKVAATISLKDRKLSARLANLDYEGGSGSGQFTINFNDLIPRTTIRGKLNGISMSEISSTVIGRKILEGPADITIDIETQGTSPKLIIENASGQLQISQTETGALAFDLSALTETSGVYPDKPSAHETKLLISNALEGQTPLDELSAIIKINAGQAQYAKFQAKFKSHITKGAANINLSSRTIDLRLLLHKRSKPAEQEPQYGASKPLDGRLLSLRGPLDNPDVQLLSVYGLPETLEQQLKFGYPTHTD